jgi:hypothetical protein
VDHSTALAWAGLGVTVIFGGLALTGHLKRRTGWAVASLGVAIGLYGLVGLATGLDLLGGAAEIWARKTTDFEKGVISTIGVGLFLSAILGIGFRYRRFGGQLVRTVLPHLPIIGATLPESEATIQKELIVSTESVERLREAYSCWGPTIQFAYELLLADVCIVQYEAEWKRCMGRILQNYVLPFHIRRKSDLDTLLSTSGPFTKDKFAELIVLFRGVLIDYMHLVGEIKETGRLVLGEEWLSGSGAVELSQRHFRCFEELRRLRSRSDTRHVTDHIFHDLERLLPKPPA